MTCSHEVYCQRRNPGEGFLYVFGTSTVQCLRLPIGGNIKCASYEGRLVTVCVLRGRLFLFFTSLFLKLNQIINRGSFHASKGIHEELRKIVFVGLIRWLQNGFQFTGSIPRGRGRLRRRNSFGGTVTSTAITAAGRLVVARSFFA